jgi:hypothetical protein
MCLAPSESASPLGKGERIEVRGSQRSRFVITTNPHPALSLLKREAGISLNGC